MTTLLFILIAIVGRLMVHIPNVTPMTSLALLAPVLYSKRSAFLMVFTSLLLSDISLHFVLHYPAIGSWSLFTYSGTLAIIFLGLLLKNKFTLLRTLFFTANAALFFWIWTNFGTWCCAGIYAHTSAGLAKCFIAGLPFLRNGLIGSLAWSGVLVFIRNNQTHWYIPGRRDSFINLLKFIRKPN